MAMLKSFYSSVCSFILQKVFLRSENSISRSYFEFRGHFNDIIEL